MKTIMEDIKNLQEFEVQVTVPPNFRFSGVVPYDMEIVGDQAFVRMVASSVEQARTRAQEYFTV